MHSAKSLSSIFLCEIIYLYTLWQNAWMINRLRDSLSQLNANIMSFVKNVVVQSFYCFSIIKFRLKILLK
jgi:hypothetical protein